MGRLSIYFAIKKAAAETAKQGKTLVQGWNAFTLRGFSNVEAYMSAEKAKQIFKEAYAEEQAAEKSDEDQGLLPLVFNQSFKKN